MDGNGLRTSRVSDAADPRLRDFTGLRDVQLRSRREPEEGLFLAEGDKTIRRALAAGYRIRAVLLAERWLDAMGDLPAGTDVLVVDDALLAETTGFPVHRGALASMDRKPLPSLDDVLEGARRAVVLEDLADHTNLGLVFRSAAALGVDAVVLTPRCADPLYRRAVRPGWARCSRCPGRGSSGTTGSSGRPSAASRSWRSPAPDATPIDDVEPRVPAPRLALGSEATGCRRGGSTPPTCACGSRCARASTR
jgi:hypothetical protein